MPNDQPATRRAAKERLMNCGLRYDGEKWVEYDAREVPVPEDAYLAALKQLGFLVIGGPSTGWAIIDHQGTLAGVLQYRP